MANDHDVLDLEVLQGKSNDRIDAVILLKVMLATLRCTKISPGAALKSVDSGTRASEPEGC